jgi:hypothetical protein
VKGNTGNTVIAGDAALTGDLTVGSVSGGKALVVSGSGTGAKPGASDVQIYFSGTDIYAYNNSGAKSKLNGVWA